MAARAGGEARLAQGLGVAQELEVHARAVLVDPLAGQFLDRVRDVAERREAGFAGVDVFVAAEQRDHLVRLAVDGGLDGGFAGHEGFFGVRLGGGVRGAALEQAGFRDADFDAGDMGADDFGEGVAGAAELGVTERVRGGVRGDVIAVGIDEAFLRRLTRLIERAGLPTRGPSLGAARYLELMRVDKKSEAGQIRFVLIDAPGHASLHRADDALVAET